MATEIPGQRKNKHQKGTFAGSTWRNWNICSALVGMENGWQFRKKLKIGFSCDPAILLLDVYPKEVTAES